MSRIYLVDTGKVHEKYSQVVGKYYSVEDIQKCPSVPGPSEVEKEARLIMDALFDADGKYDTEELTRRFIDNTRDEIVSAEKTRQESLLECVKKQNDIWNKVRELQIMLEYPDPIPPDGYLYLMRDVITKFQEMQEKEGKE